MATLQQRIDELHGLYGPRNAMCLRGDQASWLLNDAILRFSRLVRKNSTDKIELTKALASIFSRACAVASGFGFLPIVDALIEKFGQTHCTYCGKTPCACAKDRDRKKSDLTPDLKDQRSWTINDWIRHVDGLYGANNRTRGTEHALLRLAEEVHEAHGVQLMMLSKPDTGLDELQRLISREFADILAWIFAFAGILELDLDHLLETRYAGNCNRCGYRPCKCGPIWGQPTRARADSVIGE